MSETSVQATQATPTQKDRPGGGRNGALPQGLVQVYTGEGKGKTTAAFGLALRAAGRGLRVKVIQFLKGQESGEVTAARTAGIEVERFGDGGWVNLENPSEADRARAAAGLSAALAALPVVDVLILDEANVALAAGLLPMERLRELFFDGRPQGVEIVLTGRGAPVELVMMADLVTEMLAIKHPYGQGILARKGIEY
ncbi:MAG: cob(I)yrinic acid a,c-diamide adenosyltransferase [Pseudomonadota bacterium]